MSISFRLRPASLLLAGALLVPSAAFAQEGAPSIVPANNNPTAPVPAPVASPATAPTNSQPMIDSMSFVDVDVTELLSIISTQFDVPIAIAGDVTGKLRSINIKGKTAEQAINTVILAAQLSSQKTADGTYIISKAAQAPTPSAEPAVVTPIAPASGFGGNPLPANNGVLGAFGSNANPDTANNMFSTQPEEPMLVPTGKGADAQERTFQVPIRNVKASMMAYWLDPANHELPVDIRIAKQLENQYNNRNIIKYGISGGRIISDDPNQNIGQDAFNQPFDAQGVVPAPVASNPYITSSAQLIDTRANAQFGRGGQGGRGGQNGGRGGVGGRNGQNGGGTFELPEGVSRIVAVDPQNALLVFGTPEGAAKLANTIRFLDRPLRQVEIEAQFLSISTNDASTYGFDFSAARGNFSASSEGNAGSGGLQLGFFRGNFNAKIAASVASGKAKVLTAPRVTAINNLTASLQQNTNIPIRLNTNTTVSNNGIATQNSQALFYIQTTIGLQVTPTINNDDTVTVLMQPQLTTAGSPNSSGDQTFTTQFIQTIANVRDGETIALGGLRSTNVTIDKTKVPLVGDIPLIGKLFRSRSSASVESELIIFLTARIIRRVGDDDAVGTNDIPVGIGG